MSQLLDQPDRLQLAQRLADGGTADPEALGQILLPQPGAERDPARDDLDLELVGEVVGAAGTAGRLVGHVVDPTAGRRPSERWVYVSQDLRFGSKHDTLRRHPASTRSD